MPPPDFSVAHPALIYDYWLGGENNFPDAHQRSGRQDRFIGADLRDTPAILAEAAFVDELEANRFSRQRFTAGS